MNQRSTEELHLTCCEFRFHPQAWDPETGMGKGLLSATVSTDGFQMEDPLSKGPGQAAPGLIGNGRDFDLYLKERETLENDRI